MSVTINGEQAEVSVETTYRLRVRARAAQGLSVGDPRGVGAVVEVFHQGHSLGTKPLTLDTYRIVVFGDSIMWGQGLLESPKAPRLLGDRLTIPADPYRRLVACVDRSANSGAGVRPGNAEGVTTASPSPFDVAPLGTPPNLAGEVNVGIPSIERQVEAWIAVPLGEREEVELVIVDGGINDIRVTTIIDPFASDGQLVAATRQICGTEMGALLNKIAFWFPRAKIVVTGYYQIVSDDTNLNLLFETLMDLITIGALLIAPLPVGIVVTEGTKRIWQARAAYRSLLFASTANASLAGAVRAVNTPLPSPRVALAIPAFGSRNAIFGPESYLWGCGPNLTPLDPVAGGRAALCAMAFGAGAARAVCNLASLGHPNVTGAGIYAEAIYHALNSLP